MCAVTCRQTADGEDALEKKTTIEEVSRLKLARSNGYTRREFLENTGKLAAAIGVGVVGIGSLVGCEIKQPNSQQAGATAQTVQIKLGIFGGNQTLWRYFAYKKDDLLRPKGYDATFKIFNSEQALRAAFLQKEVDIIASLPTFIPSLLDAGRQAQYFLPIAWIKEGYPLIADVNAVIRTVPDLVGRRVAVFQPDHPGMAYWRAFVLRNYGFRLEDKLKLVETPNPERSLLEGLVDAAIVDSSAWSQLRNTGSFTSITDLRTEWEKISGSKRLLLFGGYIADADWIKQHQGFVEEFVKLNAEALKTYKTSRDAILVPATSYNDGGKERLPQEINEFIATYLGYNEVEPERVYVSKDDIQDYETVFRLLFESGSLKQNIEATEKLFYVSQKR